jgi:prevent-host-death family protein
MKNLKTISAAEARKRFAEITDDVRTTGTSYSIVRHGKEVARMVPPAIQPDAEVDPNLEGDIDEFFAEYKGVLEELAKR